MSVLGSIYQHLKADSTFMGLIDNRLTTAWGIDEGFTRVILGYSTSRDNELARIGSLDVDIFFPGNSIEQADAIKARAEQVLEGVILEDTQAGKTIRLYWQTEALIPEDDNQVVHWSMKFDLRYIRNTQE